MLKNISNLGDAALYCDFGNEINKETNSKIPQETISLLKVQKDTIIKKLNLKKLIKINIKNSKRLYFFILNFLF